MLTVYDWHGNYGHPDHIKVHTVGHRAAELAGTSSGLRGDDEPRPHRAHDGDGPSGRGADQRRQRTSIRTSGADDGNPMGMPEAEITHAVDVSALRRGTSVSRCAATAARSPTPASSWRCPTRRSRLRSAPSGSSRRAQSRVCAPGGCSNDPSVPGPARAGRSWLGHRPRSRSRRDRARARHRPSPTGLRRSARCRSSPARCCAVGRRLRRSPRLWRVDGADRTRVSPRSRRRRASRWRIGSTGCGARWRGTWTDLGARYLTFRDGVVGDALVALRADTVVFSHFVAINAAIGAALGDDRLVVRSLDNCSVTVIDARRRAYYSLLKVATRQTP